ncbi:MAG TPA: bacillithiol transferase BstA [Terracidiphilus sp.]|nr:bacillithiol transferase BstA [Terracidiphilus sp.]
MTNLRYPIGHFTAPVETSPAARARHLEGLRLLPQRLREAVAGLTEDQLDTPYREGGWTVRQVVHHVADSHMNAYVRTKLALTEDWPTIKPYDEAAWAELADGRRMPVEISLALIDALHARWVALLESLGERDFERGYHHPQSGRQSLGTMLALYDWHSRHHTAHITALRARMGW